MKGVEPSSSAWKAEIISRYMTSACRYIYYMLLKKMSISKNVKIIKKYKKMQNINHQKLKKSMQNIVEITKNLNKIKKIY